MFYRISLRLGPSPQCPEGCDERGYEIIAPLDQDGFLDASELERHEALGRVEHFAPGEQRRYGRLIYRPSNDGRGMWAFDYGISPSGDDEELFGLEKLSFEIDAIIPLRDRHGAFQPFRVVRLEPVVPHEYGFRDQPRSDY